MIPPVHLLPFLAVAVVVVITPGADMALVTKNALLHGRRPALATAVGINLGILFWTAAAALGLAALIAASQTAFTAIKLAGAAYLIFLGLQALRASRADQRANLPASVGAPISGRVALRQGLVSNLLNPKIAIFFTSLLPQFIGTHGQTAVDLLFLGALFNAMGIAWLLAYAVVAARGRDVLTRPRVKRVLDRLSGIVLIAIGARLAVEHRQ
jgi:RhtB (resistance to homoserine/threonine) family protein